MLDSALIKELPATIEEVADVTVLSLPHRIADLTPDTKLFPPQIMAEEFPEAIPDCPHNTPELSPPAVLFDPDKTPV